MVYADQDQLVGSLTHGLPNDTIVLLYEKKFVTICLDDELGVRWQRTYTIDDTLLNFNASVQVLRSDSSEYLLLSTRDGINAY